jgi:hypothetical protein
MSDEKIEAAKAEVHRLLEEKFIEPVAYPTWLANVASIKHAPRTTFLYHELTR